MNLPNHPKIKPENRDKLQVQRISGTLKHALSISILEQYKDSNACSINGVREFMFSAGVLKEKEDFERLLGDHNTLDVDFRGVPYWIDDEFDNIPESFQEECERIIHHWTTCIFPSYPKNDRELNDFNNSVIDEVFEPKKKLEDEPHLMQLAKITGCPIEELMKALNARVRSEVVSACGDIISWNIDDIKQRVHLFDHLAQLPKLRSLVYTPHGIEPEEYPKSLPDGSSINLWTPPHLRNLGSLMNLVYLRVYYKGNRGRYSFDSFEEEDEEVANLEFDTNHLTEGLPHLTKLRRLDLDLSLKYLCNATGFNVI